ncbi:hypothetical protein H5410_022662 [Solanum commersonii]|uniref:Uncharacterized protein n=1 Tax=Solanum commersonii TaxID=4109 RepID=A0A9J5ZG33_SOLCO|nr:hypothetical protein H5410_022662 [Solanum commersonii]
MRFRNNFYLSRSSDWATTSLRATIPLPRTSNRDDKLRKSKRRSSRSSGSNNGSDGEKAEFREKGEKGMVVERDFQVCSAICSLNFGVRVKKKKSVMYKGGVV